MATPTAARAARHGGRWGQSSRLVRGLEDEENRLDQGRVVATSFVVGEADALETAALDGGGKSGPERSRHQARRLGDTQRKRAKNDNKR